MFRYLHAIFLAFLLILTASTASAYAPQSLSMSEQKADNQTDPAGNIVWKEKYRPFGEKVNNQAASADNRQWFHGKAVDTDTGLSYFGARYYDPVLGRFMGVDPVGFQEDNIHSFNKYAYGNNNPYKFIDKDGKYADLIIEAVSLTVGFKSLIDNARAGNYRSAFVDAGGIVADLVGAALPGVPGVAGLGIKASREAIEQGAKGARLLAEPVYKTTKEATFAAEKLGYKKINETIHDGEAVYKSGRDYITRDATGHNGGAWKMADSIKNLGSKETRLGTFDVNLRKIGD